VIVIDATTQSARHLAYYWWSGAAAVASMRAITAC